MNAEIKAFESKFTEKNGDLYAIHCIKDENGALKYVPDPIFMDGQQETITSLEEKAQLATLCLVMWIECVKTKKVQDGYVVVKHELDESIAEAFALKKVRKPIEDRDKILNEIAQNAYKEQLKITKWNVWDDYKKLIDAQLICQNSDSN